MIINSQSNAEFPPFKEFNFNDERMIRAEAAKYLGVSSQFLEGDVVSNRHKIPYIKIGRKVFYLKSDLDLWIKSSKVEV